MKSEDRRKLEEAASRRGEKPAIVIFPAHAFVDDAELLVELVKDFFEARDDRMSGRLKRLLKRRRQGRASERELSALELRLHDESPVNDVRDRQWPQYTLRVLVAVIMQIWHEHGGKGAGSFYNDSKGRHDGPLIRLLHELFRRRSSPQPPPRAMSLSWTICPRTKARA